MMEIRTALKCFNQRKCRFLTPCFYVRKRPVSISVKRGFYARKIPLSDEFESRQRRKDKLWTWFSYKHLMLKMRPSNE